MRETTSLFLRDNQMVSLAKLAVISRAILKKSLIFLLDEATLGLDSRTEKEI